MIKAQYGLVAIGNAIVDVLASATEEFVAGQHTKYGMNRASMNLIDEPRALQLYDQMGAAVEASGGSAGNTIACFASFGGTGAYIGKVGKDQLGDIFRHDLRAQGVTHTTPPVESGTATARCMILVTPDGERTMNTFLGAATELGPDDIDENLIKASEITYLEGYLFDKDDAKQAFIKAATTAKQAGRKVALTLSDSFCVERHRADFQKLVEYVDILFANEAEITSLYQVENFDDAIPVIKDKCEIAVLTRGKDGSTIVRGDEITKVGVEPVVKVVDATGAGDSYAAGFLYGYIKGMSMAECGKLGAIAAAEVISHFGPRPQVALSTLIPEQGSTAQGGRPQAPAVT